MYTPRCKRILFKIQFEQFILVGEEDFVYPTHLPAPLALTSSVCARGEQSCSLIG